MKLYPFVDQTARATYDMAVTGAYVDVPWTHRVEKELYDELTVVESSLDHIFGEHFNYNSGKQVSELLFNRMGLPVLNETKKGGPSTSAGAFDELRFGADVSEDAQYVLDEIIKFRKLRKMLGTYVVPFRTKHVRNDGRIHTTYNVGRSLKYGGTRTGRLSSSNPNMQNLPRDARVRGVIIPTPGMSMFDADYSQLELRIAAWLAQDKQMLRAFAEGKDIHTYTTSLMEGVTYDQVVAYLNSDDPKIVILWKDKRWRSKRVNFGILYGISAIGLMRQFWGAGIDVTQKATGKMIDRWFNSYPTIKKMLDEWEDRIIHTGELATPFGRTRHLPGGERKSGPGRRVLRQGLNFPIQSTASDITLASLVILHRFFREQGGGQLTLTVHDSVMGEYFVDDYPDIQEVVQEVMEDHVAGFLKNEFGIEGLPLKVDVDTALERWK